jgi:hypothetical protein
MYFDRIGVLGLMGQLVTRVKHCSGPFGNSPACDFGRVLFIV